MAQVEALVAPDSIENDIGWESLAGIGGVYRFSPADFSNFKQLTCQCLPRRSVALVDTHRQILPILASQLVSAQKRIQPTEIYVL